jgi:retinol dehydrogenase 12
VKSGEYYTPVGVPGNGSWQSQDMDLARKLWEWTEKELEGYKL